MCDGEPIQDDTYQSRQIILTVADNGVVIEDDDGHLTMYEEPDDEALDATPRLAQKVCWALIDLLGWSGSRYDAERVRVTLEPGDKHEAAKAD